MAGKLGKLLPSVADMLKANISLSRRAFLAMVGASFLGAAAAMLAIHMLLSVPLPFCLPFLALGALPWLYVKGRAASRAKVVDENLPFLALVFAMSAVIPVSPSLIFSRILDAPSSTWEEALKAEARQYLKLRLIEGEIGGCREYGKYNPHEKFGSFVRDFADMCERGGDLPGFTSSFLSQAITSMVKKVEANANKVLTFAMITMSLVICVPVTALVLVLFFVIAGSLAMAANILNMCWLYVVLQLSMSVARLGLGEYRLYDYGIPLAPLVATFNAAAVAWFLMGKLPIWLVFPVVAVLAASPAGIYFVVRLTKEARWLNSMARWLTDAADTVRVAGSARQAIMRAEPKYHPAFNKLLERAKAIVVTRGYMAALDFLAENSLNVNVKKAWELVKAGAEFGTEKPAFYDMLAEFFRGLEASLKKAITIVLWPLAIVSAVCALLGALIPMILSSVVAIAQVTVPGLENIRLVAAAMAFAAAFSTGFVATGKLAGSALFVALGMLAFIIGSVLLA